MPLWYLMVSLSLRTHDFTPKKFQVNIFLYCPSPFSLVYSYETIIMRYMLELFNNFSMLYVSQINFICKFIFSFFWDLISTLWRCFHGCFCPRPTTCFWSRPTFVNCLGLLPGNNSRSFPWMRVESGSSSNLRTQCLPLFMGWWLLFSYNLGLVGGDILESINDRKALSWLLSSYEWFTIMLCIG